MKRVFVNTSGFVALLLAEDRCHDSAEALFELAARDRWTLVTTNAIVIETYSVLLARAREGRRNAIAFLDAITSDQSDTLRVERIRAEDEYEAGKLVRAHVDNAYSLCDALSFVVMQRLEIAEGIAFDRHFREYGRFTILG